MFTMCYLHIVKLAQSRTNKYEVDAIALTRTFMELRGRYSLLEASYNMENQVHSYKII